MKNICKASIIKTGLTNKEVSNKFDAYVKLQPEATLLASDMGEQITDRVNDYNACTCTFTVTHCNWNIVAKTCFNLGNFFGMHGIPIEFDLTDTEENNKIIVLDNIKNFFAIKQKEAA